MDTSTVAEWAFVLSLVAGVVGIFNLAATSAKLKLDLYNRRFKIYEDVLALYQVMYDDWDTKKVEALERAMIRSLRESKFLFDSRDGIYDVILKFKNASGKNTAYHIYGSAPNNVDARAIMAQSAAEGRMACEPLILELEEKLLKYLDFRRISGWT